MTFRNLETSNENVASESFSPFLPKEWRKKLFSELEKPYFKQLIRFLKDETLENKKVYPASENIFRALQAFDFNEARVVILGQDPYHGENQAIGFSFAIPNNHFPKPPSLQNIFKEIKSDLNVEFSNHESDLSGWVQQGVLLLNTVLTVRAGEPLSHRGKGWETFTDQILKELGAREKPLVFLLWGSAAQQKKQWIGKQHFVLEAVHPSPLSAYRGFLGCKHFSKTNAFLKSRDEPEIDWSRTSIN